MSLRERIEGIIDGSLGIQAIALVAVCLIGFTAYAVLLMPPYKKEFAVTPVSYPATPPPQLPITPVQEEAKKAEKEEVKVQIPQAHTPAATPTSRPPAKPPVKSKEQEFRETARLLAHYAGPLDNAWEKLAGHATNTGQNTQTRPEQTLEIPPAQGMQNTNYAGQYNNGSQAGNVWQHDFTSRGHGQPGVLQPPQSPFMVMRGSVIPVRLQEGFDTQTPGQITAVVIQDVKDTRSGKYTMIPAGARIVGAYNTNLPYDQDRIPTAWDELQFPNGETMSLAGFPGADSAGMAGNPVEVNTHFWKTAGRSLLLTLSGAAAEVTRSVGYNSSGEYEAGAALAHQGGRQIERRSQQIWDRGGYRGPTGTAKAGDMFLVQVTAPLSFPGDYCERAACGQSQRLAGGDYE